MRKIEIRRDFQNSTLNSQNSTLNTQHSKLIYGVETRDVNKAVKNNPSKFPDGYIIQISKDELEDLRWKFSTAKLSPE